MWKYLKFVLLGILIPSLIFAIGISYENETSYTSMRGSFVDGQSWWGGEILGGELVTNGTMEVDANWNNHALEGGDTQARYDMNVDPDGIGSSGDGQYCRKIVVDAGYEGMKSDTFTTVTNTHYKVTYKVYVVGGTRYGVSVRRGSDGGDNVYSDDETVVTDTWTDQTIYYTETAGGSSAEIRFHSGGIGGAGTYYFDIVSIKSSTSLSTQSFTGNLLIVDDNNSKYAKGYIGAAGTGETKTALPNNITAITKADPVVVASTAHDLSIGMEVYFSGLTEMTELNGTYKTVTAVGDADHFSINDTSGYGAAETTGGACGWEITEPNANAVHIFQERGLVNEGWLKDNMDDHNAGASFDFDVYRTPGVKAQQW